MRVLAIVALIGLVCAVAVATHPESQLVGAVDFIVAGGLRLAGLGPVAPVRLPPCGVEMDRMLLPAIPGDLPSLCYCANLGYGMEWHRVPQLGNGQPEFCDEGPIWGTP